MSCHRLLPVVTEARQWQAVDEEVFVSVPLVHHHAVIMIMSGVQLLLVSFLIHRTVSRASDGSGRDSC